MSENPAGKVTKIGEFAELRILFRAVSPDVATEQAAYAGFWKLWVFEKVTHEFMCLMGVTPGKPWTTPARFHAV